MTAHNLIKSMTKRGNAIIGVGCFAAALESTVSTDKIIKIGNNLDDKWLDYYHEICVKYQGALCIPSIQSFYKDCAHGYYVCTMEKLYYYTDSDTRAAKTLVSRYITDCMTKDEWLDAAVEYPKHFGHLGQFLQVMDSIKEGSDLEDECCDDDENYIHAYRRVDLHQGNILSRACGQLVITDPWCSHNYLMDEVCALDEWASRTLGYVD